MGKLDEISKRMHKEMREQDDKEIMAFTRDIVDTPSMPTYPLNLFDMKFYIPMRALVEFKVDTVQIGSYLKHGEVRSSLYRDWMSIAVLPTNKVAIIDTKKNNLIVSVLPPLVKTVEVKDNRTLTDGNITKMMLRAQDAKERSNLRESFAMLDGVGREMQEKFDMSGKNLEDNLNHWKIALDKIDSYLGRNPKTMIDKIKASLPKDSINENKTEKIEDITDAFG